MIKYRQAKKAAALFFAAAMTAGCLAGCKSTSSTDTDSSTSAGAGDVDGVDDDLNSPASSDNDSDSAYTNPYTLSNINVFEIDFSKYVDVSNWKNTVVTKEEATEPEYEAMYDLVYELESTYGLTTSEITDRGIQGGDTVTMDFVGYMDGEELENGSGTDQTLMIGSGRFIDGFEEGLLGAKTGDQVTLELNFPDPYPNNTDLSGKAVTFEVTVTKVEGLENVSDEDIKTATDGAYETYDAFAQDYNDNQAKEYQELKIWQKVMENVEQLDICQELQDDFINTYLYTYGAMAEAYGMSIETILYYSYGYQISIEEFTEAMTPTANDYATQTCAVLAIADMDGITVDEQDLEEAYNAQLANYESEEAMIAAGATREELEFSLLLDLVEQHIYDTIQVQ
jgi:trigger factor